jgi:hypothetical protein
MYRPALQLLFRQPITPLTKEDVPLFAVSKTDALCLAVLLCVDLSVVGWLQNSRLQQHAKGVAVAALVATSQELDSTPSSVVSPTAPDAETTEPDVDETDDGLWQHTYGDYVVQTVSGSSEDGDVILQVLKGGQLVFTTNNHQFFDPEAPDNDFSGNIPRPLANITGNGIQDLVVAEWSGGAHCCMTYYIFELGNEFRLIDTIFAEHGGANFEDVDGDGIPEIQMSDWSYAYVFGCFASSPSPDMVLRYTNGHYEVASDLMQTAAPDATGLQQMADEIRTNYAHMVETGEWSDEWAADSGLWQQMLDLIYGGHEEESLELFNLAWPQGLDGREQALSNFVAAVTNSTYWQAMYGMEDAVTDAVERVKSLNTEAQPSSRQ